MDDYKKQGNLFTQFAARLKQNEELSHSLTYLKQRYTLNPNLVMFTIWYGSQGYGRLTRQALVQLLTNTVMWHDRIVKPLAKLMGLPVNQALLAQGLYNEIETLAKMAEYYEQMLFYDYCCRFGKLKRKPNQYLLDACHNLARYLQESQLILDKADYNILSLIMAKAFDQVSQRHINMAVENIISSSKPKKKSMHNQLLFEEM